MHKKHKKYSIKDNKRGEKKTASFSFEVKQDSVREDKDYFYFEGYLSTFGNVDEGDDMFVAGCFDESLKEMRPDLLWFHQRLEVIGVFEELQVNEKGLWVKGKLPKSDSLVSGRVIPQMKVGSVRSMSVGYYAMEYDLNDDDVRVITKAYLVEGSLVSQPMNRMATVDSFKSLEIDDLKQLKSKRDVEKTLRESGAFSRKGASYFASMLNLPGATPDAEQKSDAVKQLEAATHRLNKLLEQTKE